MKERRKLVRGRNRIFVFLLVILSLSFFNCNNAPETPLFHTVVFETNGGTVIPEQKVTHNTTVLKPLNPEKEGFQFGGWFIDEGFTTQFDFSRPITMDIILYAKWIKNIIIDNTETKIVYSFEQIPTQDIHSYYDSTTSFSYSNYENCVYEFCFSPKNSSTGNSWLYMKDSTSGKRIECLYSGELIENIYSGKFECLDSGSINEGGKINLFYNEELFDSIEIKNNSFSLDVTRFHKLLGVVSN